MYFYELPNEIIRQIYLYDPTYKDIYDKCVKIMNKIPKYIHKTDKYYVFQEKFEDYYSSNCNVSIYNKSYKKAFLTMVWHYSRPEDYKNYFLYVQ